MRRALASLFLLVAFLLSFAGSASAYVDYGSKNRVGDFGDPFAPQVGFADTIAVYDPATGVLFYVRQNPWTMVDPLGLRQGRPKNWGKNRKRSKGYGQLIKENIIQPTVQHAKDIGSVYSSVSQHTNKANGVALAAGHATGLNKIVGLAPGLDRKLEVEDGNLVFNQFSSYGERFGTAATGAVQAALVPGELVGAGKLVKGVGTAASKALSKGSAKEIVGETSVRVQHATSSELADEIIRAESLGTGSSPGGATFSRVAKNPGKAPTKAELKSFGVEKPDKVIEFDVRQSELKLDELDDVRLPDPTNLKDRNVEVLDVTE